MFAGQSPTAVPKALKVLLITNVAIFVFDKISGGVISEFLQLANVYVFQGQLWRIGTYMFVHDLNNIFHILFNMLCLYMFGIPVLEQIGQNKFLQLYLFGGIFAALCAIGLDFFTPGITFTKGASGAVYALLVAFALFFPNRQILLFFLFPVQAKWAVAIFIGISLLFIAGSDGTSHVAHLGGIVFGFLYIKYQSIIETWSLSLKSKREQMAFKKAKKARQALHDIDPILEKISKEGMESLTRSEKAALKKASQLKKEQKTKIIKMDDYRKRRL